MPFTTEQRQRTAQTWTAATGHKFISSLWAGSVPDSVLATYLAQDYLFVDAFVALMGGAIAHSDSPSARMQIARQLGLIANDEDGYFVRALDHFGVKESRPRPATQAFVNLMLESRTDYASALVVLLVAEWLYLDWATPTPVPPTPSNWLCAEWIDLHRGAGFEAWVELLKRETDRVAANAHEKTRARMEALFERAVKLELDFFDAAYE